MDCTMSFFHFNGVSENDSHVKFCINITSMPIPISIPRKLDRRKVEFSIFFANRKFNHPSWMIRL